LALPLEGLHFEFALAQIFVDVLAVPNEAALANAIEGDS
jgi:hypothetical protein